MALRREILNPQELKSVLFTKLSKEGKLDKLRASIRSEIIGSFYSNRIDEQKERKRVAQPSLESFKFINWLIEDHLERNHLEFTRSVFALEQQPKPSGADKLKLIDILQALDIFPTSKLGAKIMALFIDNNEGLFLWKVLHTLANHKENNEDHKRVNLKLPTEDKDDIEIKGSLHQKLKLIDEIYDKKKAVSNQPILNEFQGKENKQNVKIIEKSENTFVEPIDKFQNLGLHLTDRQINQQQNEIETREKWIIDFQKENEIQRLNLEMKWKDMDQRYLELNNLQERFAFREKQLAYRERQLNETALEMKRLKEESEKKNVFNNNLEKSYLIRLRKEYEGKLKDTVTQVQYFKNKLYEMEGLYQHQTFKHRQQCLFLNEQLKLQHERISYLQGVIRDYQNHMSIHNASTWHEPIPRFMKTLDPVIGADLQETYFDTSLNASHLAPELELGRERNISELPMLGDLNTIRSRLRELESEADQLEFNYTKLEKSDFEESFITTGNFSSSENFSFNKKPSHFQFSFDNVYSNEICGDIDKALSDINENSQYECNNSESFYPVKIRQTTFIPEKAEYENFTNKKYQEVKSSPQKENVKFMLKEGKAKSSAFKEINVEEDDKHVKSVVEETAHSKTVEQKTPILNSAEQEEAILETTGQLKDELESLIVSPIINSDKFVVSHLEERAHSSKTITKENFSDDDCSSRLTPRSSTPIEHIETSSNERKTDFERIENAVIKEPISWEKVSGASDNEFEW